jgi:hypothetical protein
VTWGEEPAGDSQVEVTESPRIFKTTLENVPADVPYLNVGVPARTAGRRRVGLIWNSSQWNPVRCVPFALLRNALEGLDWDLFSLQFGPERHLLPPTRPDEGDVLDTAADMLNLDLVITVDTLGAHLAGAWPVPSRSCFHSRRTCAGCCTGPMALGTRRCAFSGKPNRTTGPAFLMNSAKQPARSVSRLLRIGVGLTRYCSAIIP